MTRLTMIFGLAGVALVCTLLPGAGAATPSSGTLTDTSGPITYSAGPFAVPNPTPVPIVDSGPECANPVQPCDEFLLTVSLPSNYKELNPDKIVKFSAGWTDTGTGQADYDLYVYKGTVTSTDGSQAAFVQSASKANPEVTSTPVFDGTQTFTVIVVPYQPTGETLHVSISLEDGAPSAGGGGTVFGSATPTQPGVPRYQTLAPPDGSGANASSGEFNVGFDPKTGNILENSWGDVFRVTPPELRSPALPASGPALWADVSPPIASTTTADPILVTDQSTGRTFASNQTTGTEALFAYSDDDGATWTDPVVGLPDGGADHESVGVGPYPAALSSLATNYPNAVYYCSQAQVPDLCQRSDTGGLTWGPGVVAAAGTGCQSLHGHIKVAPNGTVYLPNRSCGGSQGGVMSTDAGTTWTQFNVPGSGGSGSDPSLGIDSGNTLYYCYTPNDGSAHVAVSHDGGKTWGDDHDLGAAVGVKQAVFPEAVAGDPGRAACGFVGTDTAGNFGSTSFPGKWFLFLATTYDAGKTWTTVNATPNDPVQGAGGICLQGISCSGNNRNLLDFNEVTIDDHGRVLYGYDDGCVTTHCLDTSGDANDFVAYARIARQTGGKSLFAKYDPVEPVAPKQPYLSGTRDQNAATLTWSPGDNGGSDVTSYQVWRGTTSGSETQIATVSGDKNSFTDTTGSASVADYYYKVVEVTAVGSSPASNEVDLKVVQSGPKPTPCKAPGLTILTDASGDSLTGTAGTDLHSLQISQPYSATGGKLTFQINTDPGLNPQPPDSYWYVSFKAPDGTVHGVRMWYDPASPTQPTFQSYVASGNTSGGVDGRFVKSGTQKPADASSSYDPTTGTIVIVVPLADVGLKEGDTVFGFNAASVQAVTTPALGGAEVVDGMPDALAYSGSYTVVTNSSCAANTAPTAALTGTPTSGTSPLTVAFDGSGSHDPDAGDSVASYTFNFGDGTAPATQSTATVSHTYASAGHYQPSLTVTDTHGASSTNSATVAINVTNPPVVFEDDDAHIAYDNGWHSVSSSSASAGHFHTSNGKGASFAFSTSVANGSLTYYYGTSSKGGSADLYLDGKLVQSVSFQGGAGDGHTPAFGVSVNVPLTTSGSHTFELRNVQGLAYLDKLAVTDGVSQAQPATSPGQTQTSSSSLSPGKAQSTAVTVPANAVGLAVLTESSLNVPYTLAVLNTSGSVLTTVKSGTNGIASVQLPVSGGAKYVVQLLDVGVGPVSIWSATTPQLHN